MVVTTDAGANTATGDLVLNGPLNVGTLGLYKRGGGSLRLNAAALPGNVALRVQGGTAICGIADCIGTNASLITSAGTTLDLNGFSQTVTNATLAGTLKMTINKGGTPNSDVLTVTDPVNPLSYGGDLVVTNVGGAPAIGDSFKLFSSPVSYAGAFTSVTLPALVERPGLAKRPFRGRNNPGDRGLGSADHHYGPAGDQLRLRRRQRHVIRRGKRRPGPPLLVEEERHHPGGHGQPDPDAESRHRGRRRHLLGDG